MNFGRRGVPAPPPLIAADPPEPVADPPPNPPGVKGYVVACISGKTSLTHSSLLDRDQADREADQYRKADRYGARYVVCEVREVT